MSETSPTDVALARFREGYNCSQSTLSAFAEQFGLPLEPALRLAAPFGGGIGRQGEVCGAASGALMALGLRFGTATADKAAKDRAYAVAADFVRQFEERCGAVRCRDLIHADMTTPEGLAGARERKVFSSECPRFVAAAVEIAESIMRDAARDPQP
jgi:C_GCAxxG_C_C family probable redox protein